MKKYLEIANKIQQQITEKKYKEFEKLPTEINMTKEFNVTRMTIRQALQHLQQENIITKKQNIGNFVKGKKIQGNSQGLISFTESLLQKKITPTTKIISLEIIMPNEEIQKALLLNEEKVFKIQRIRFGNQIPYIYEIDYIPLKNVKNFLEENALSLFSYFENELKISIDSCFEEIEAVNASTKICEYLQINENTPLLYVKSINYNNIKPLFISLAYYKSEYYNFTNTIIRKK